MWTPLSAEPGSIAGDAEVFDHTTIRAPERLEFG